mmetsp:Transcript_8377/g.25165  ORF Transcript_8377/g.25165 Transcript_8377/m.25165 type:complete len:85 (+) Transcript_8377:683-937(+)
MPLSHARQPLRGPADPLFSGRAGIARGRRDCAEDCSRDCMREGLTRWGHGAQAQATEPTAATFGAATWWYRLTPHPSALALSPE